MSKRKLFVVLALVATFFVGSTFGSVVHAQTTTIPTATPTSGATIQCGDLTNTYLPSFFTGNCNKSETAVINGLVKNVIASVFGIAGLIALGFIMYAGFILLTAGKESDEKNKEAKATITNAVIGLLVVILAFVIVSVIENILGIGGDIGTTVKPPCPAGVVADDCAS